MKKFIMDMGRDLIAVSERGERVDIPRYALWKIQMVHYDGVAYGPKPVVVDVNQSLDKLVEEYGECPVFYMDELANR